MPELPEVEVIRRGLKKKLLGETVQEVKILRQDSIAYPSPEKFCRLIKGRTFVDIRRRGKYLLLHMDKKTREDTSLLLVHLRMSGRLLFLREETVVAKLKFLRVLIKLMSNSLLCFDDMRVFGRLCYVDSQDVLAKVIPSFNNLGIEPLARLKAKQLLKLFAHRRQAIKTTLLDQSLIAGIGNIYADEILFLSGINPLLPSGLINYAEAERLAEFIPETLYKAIEKGGSSIKDFVNTEGVNGNYQSEALVYGRAGQGCRKCGSTIERLKINGRSSHFCPACQSETKRLLIAKK